MKNIPEMRFNGFTDAWEQRKFSDLYAPLVERNSDLLPYNKTLSVATMTYKTDGNGAADSSLANYKRLRTGDIAFEGHTSKSFRYGRFVLNDVGDGIMSPRFSALRPLAQMPTNFWKYYIHYEPIMRKILVASTKAGTMMNELVIDEFLKSSVLVPSIEEQTRIGSILKNIDNLITLHQRKYEKLIDVKNAMLVTMFPRPGKDKPDMRFKGYESAWQTVRLGDIVERVTRKNSNFESTLPLTISAQYGLIDQNEFFNKQVASKDVSNYYLIRNGEFAYNKSTSSDAPFGAVKRLDRYDCGVLSTLYIMFRIKEEAEVDSDYLVEYYSTNLWHEGIQKIAAEGARNHGLLNIVPDDFFNTTLMIPQNISEQRKIGQYFRSLDKLIEIKKNKVEKLQDVKKALLQAMFI